MEIIRTINFIHSYIIMPNLALMIILGLIAHGMDELKLSLVKKIIKLGKK